MKHKKMGFTLIELLVVVGILAILTAALIVSFNPIDQLHKAYDSRRKSDLAQIQRALETYYQDYNKYPQSDQSDPSNYEIAPGGTDVPWGSAWQPYINELPTDPGRKTYAYYSNGGQTYYLYASLDRGSVDSQACTGINNACSGAGSGISNYQTACGGVCNYGVSSSNVSP